MMYCLSRISRGQHFLLLSPGRMEAGTPRESRISRGHFFLLIRSVSYLPHCPASIYTGQRGKPKQCGRTVGQGRGSLPENRWYPPISLPRFRGARGAKCGAKPKILPHKGGQGVGQKRACPVVCPALGAGGETWTF